MAIRSFRPCSTFWRFAVVRRLAITTAAIAVAATVGCINVFWKTDVRAVARPTDESFGVTSIVSPLKAHLRDGSTVIFLKGAAVSSASITGEGRSYALLSLIPVARTRVPMDSVVAVETFEGKVLAGPSVVVSVAATAAGAMASALMAVAIFGSCPTVYADTGTGPVLQAEGFSYAIAPLMEHRDLDPLRVRPDANGVVQLELRNEALETHYINHVELVAVRHETGDRVIPDQSGRPLTVHGFSPIIRAKDRAGRNVQGVLASRDGKLFSSASSVVNSAREGDLDDWIDIDATDLPPGDSVAVVLRLRNSLLNTVLLYEGMLGGRDAADWLHTGLQRISAAVDIGRWYTRTMGMRASVEGVAPHNGEVRPWHARLGDVGPIAFRDVAIVLPRSAVDAKTARIRLRFVADNWRIDEVLVSGALSRPTSSVLAMQHVVVESTPTSRETVFDTAAVRAIAEADDQYLETRPGQHMTLVFHPDRASAVVGDSVSTYLIGWQGWYREWIRGSWLAAPTRTAAFVPGDAAVLTALRRWTERKESFEKQFFASKIPVR